MGRKRAGTTGPGSNHPVAGLYEATPDHAPVLEGDFVVGQWEGGGTHTGQAFSDFRMGSMPAASGRKMKFAGTTILRLENGQIAEELGLEDALSAMLQLGLIRLPELEIVQERSGGPLPRGWNNMPGPSETDR